MTRVKSSKIHRARRKKILKAAKGYFGSKHRLYRTAKEQVMHSLSYAYRDRRQRKRDFRKLWITRINAACRENNISYSKFINGLSKAGIAINRKMLSEIAIDNKEHFTNLVKLSTDALNSKINLSPDNDSEKIEKQSNLTENIKDLSTLTVAELRELAKEKNITGYSTMKKAELLESLK